MVTSLRSHSQRIAKPESGPDSPTLSRLLVILRRPALEKLQAGVESGAHRSHSPAPSLHLSPVQCASSQPQIPVSVGAKMAASSARQEHVFPSAFPENSLL